MEAFRFFFSSFYFVGDSSGIYAYFAGLDLSFLVVLGSFCQISMVFGCKSKLLSTDLMSDFGVREYWEASHLDLASRFRI